MSVRVAARGANPDARASKRLALSFGAFGALSAAVGATVALGHVRVESARAESAEGRPAPTTELVVGATPEHARILVDGRQVGTGKARVALGRDAHRHVVRVEAAGYGPHEEDIVLDGATVTLAIGLELEAERAAAPEPIEAPTLSPGPVAKPSAPRRARAQPSASPVASSAVPDLPADPPAPRSAPTKLLDPSDPWAR